MSKRVKILSSKKDFTAFIFTFFQLFLKTKLDFVLSLRIQVFDEMGDFLRKFETTCLARYLMVFHPIPALLRAAFPSFATSHAVDYFVAHRFVADKVKVVLYHRERI